MFEDPKEAEAHYELYPQGRIYLGRGSFKGVSVGVAPLMAKIHIPEGCGSSVPPSGWFPLSRAHATSLHKVRQKIEKTATSDGLAFVPEEIWTDCYRHHYETLARSTQMKLSWNRTPNTSATFETDVVGDGSVVGDAESIRSLSYALSIAGFEIVMEDLK